MVGLLAADPQASAIVDVIGIGAGVVDRLREQSARVEPFTASGRTGRRDMTGEFGFADVQERGLVVLQGDAGPVSRVEASTAAR